MDYQIFYERLTKPILARPWLLAFLRAYNIYFTRLLYLAYPILLAYLIYLGVSMKLAWTEILPLVLPYILIPGLSFILLTIFRKWLDRPRPYQTWAIQPLIAKDTEGQSMPSRHVFSATMISMCLLHLFPGLGTLCLFLSLGLGLVRVLGGVHYPQDVLVGYLVGLLAGFLLWLF